MSHSCNQIVDRTKPWALAKEPTKADDLDAVLYTLAESLRIIAILISPVIAESGAWNFRSTELENGVERKRRTVSHSQTRSGGDCRMDMWSANRCRYSRGSRLRVAQRLACWRTRPRDRNFAECRRLPICPLGKPVSARRRNQRETRALPRPGFRRLLCAFFERGGFTAQIGENFASEMQ